MNIINQKFILIPFNKNDEKEIIDENNIFDNDINDKNLNDNNLNDNDIIIKKKY